MGVSRDMTDTSTTYGTRDFAAALKGATISAQPPTDPHSTEETTSHSSDEFARFITLAERVVHVAKEDVTD